MNILRNVIIIIDHNLQKNWLTIKDLYFDKFKQSKILSNIGKE